MNETKSSMNKLSIVGQNVFGAFSKQNSLSNVINVLSPSIINLQETKVRKAGMLKFTGYQTFENVRSDKLGGGLLTAVDINLKPVLVNVKEDVELINVEIVKPIGSVNVLNAYVPQEYDPVSSKIKFW